MAYSSESAGEFSAQRGFTPPRNDQERFIQRRAMDLARAAESRGMPRYSGFLSDREQDLARAALNHLGCACAHFEGGWPGAERKILCVEPPDAWQEQAVACLELTVRLAADALAPQHKDYLGSLLGLELERGCLGDILVSAERPGRAWVFCLEDKADFLCRELTGVGRYTAAAVRCEALPTELRLPQPQEKTATVSSLRADAVLAVLLNCSRGQACEYISAGRVEIGHIPVESAHAPVYAGDDFTVRGKGKFRLAQINGKSRKDRIIIQYYQY